MPSLEPCVTSQAGRAHGPARLRSHHQMVGPAAMSSDINDNTAHVANTHAYNAEMSMLDDRREKRQPSPMASGYRGTGT